MIPLRKDNKVSAIVTFYEQEEFKQQVLSSIEKQVDEIIIVEDKGDLSKQRNYGLKQAKHEYVLFCDGDILVGEEFVKYAIMLLDNEFFRHIGVVGGRMTTECLTVTQELMAVLRENMYSKGQHIAGCFLTKREYFINGATFGAPPYETLTFLNWLKKEDLKQGRVNEQLIHLGEPKIITELLSRQVKYGTKEKANWVYWLAIRYLGLGNLLFLKYYKTYKQLKKDGKVKTYFWKMATLYDSFLLMFYESAVVKDLFLF